MKNFKLILVIILIFFPFFTQASVLYFEPAKIEIGVKSDFIVDLLVDVDQCINVVEGHIGFDKDKMKIIDFITGNSIMNLWIEKPEEFDYEKINQDGKFIFSGGIPGGYCGKIPGDPGQSNLLARLVFETLELSDVEENDILSEVKVLSGTKVLLNDGLGSEGKFTVQNGEIKISKATMPNIGAWKKEVGLDKIPPEPFIVELHQNPTVYDNKYYIVFYTNDKQTGVDYYEVLEKRANEEIDHPKKREFLHYVGLKKDLVGWRRANTPYLLEDQDMRSVIKVRAIDKAGNERMVEYIPQDKTLAQKTIPSFYYLGIVILLIVAIFAIYIIRKRKKISHEEENSSKNI